MGTTFIIVLFIVGLAAIVAWCVYGVRALVKRNKRDSIEQAEEINEDGSEEEDGD